MQVQTEREDLVTERGPYESRLDPKWPPAPPPEGKAADFIQYLIREKADTFFGILRVVKPNFGLPKNGPVFVTRFRDVLEVLQRPEVFTVRTYAPMMDPSIGSFMLARDGTVYNQRDKGIMRALIGRADMPTVRSMVAALTQECIDEGAENGTLEIVSNVSRKVPILLTGRFFGFPGPDLESMFRWSRATQSDMFHNQGLLARIHDDNIRAGHEMTAYVRGQLLPQRRAELRKNPALDDTVSRLLKLETPKEIGFDEARIVVNIIGLLVGGVETTSQAIVQILDQLFRRPRELDGAKAAAKAGDDALLYQYCWEALRFNPINPVVARMCVTDYRIASGTFRNKLVKAGGVVLVCTRSAMKDARELPSPRKFRLDRPPHHYMHLGYGLHTCLGDQVSRVQVPEVIKGLLLRPGLRRAAGPAGQIDFRGSQLPEAFSVAFD